MYRICCLVLVVGCVSEPAEIHYTGPVRRFVVDSISVPKNNTEARAYGGDLNGDRVVDNQLGMVIGTLSSFGDVTKHGADMIGSRVLASSVEIIADDLENDPTVGIRYFGRDGDVSELVGGEIVDGVFRTTSNGALIAHLPIFADADPSVVELLGAQLDLTADGRGGFDAKVRGGIPDAIPAAFAGVDQMIATHPSDHVAFFRLIDTQPHDFVITQEEFAHNTLIGALMTPDLELSGTKVLSIGFGVHLAPCDAGTCTTPAVTCFDRTLDGDETDLDCGGSCAPCSTGGSCTSAADCESHECNGTCAAPTCFDGVRDGFETDVDCGSQCGSCASGKACWSDSDCTSGECGAPCTGIFCGDYSLDTCQ